MFVSFISFGYFVEFVVVVSDETSVILTVTYCQAMLHFIMAVFWYCVSERNISYTRMWANAQRDGRPAKHRWRPLFNAAKFG